MGFIFKNTFSLVFVLFLVSSVNCFSQKKWDSLLKLSFDELSEKVYKGDSTLSYFL